MRLVFVSHVWIILKRSNCIQYLLDLPALTMSRAMLGWLDNISTYYMILPKSMPVRNPVRRSAKWTRKSLRQPGNTSITVARMPPCQKRILAFYSKGDSMQ